MIGKGKANKPTYKVNKKLEYYKSTSLLNKYFSRVRKKNTAQSKEENSAAEKNNKWGTWIERVSVFINGVLAILTFLLFKEAMKQNEAAKGSTNAAWAAVRQTESSMKQSAQNDAANQIKFEKSIAIADSSMKAQIKLSETTQKQLELYQKNFLAENRAYIYYYGIAFDSIQFEKPLIVEFQYKNFGKSPSIIKKIIKRISVFENTPTNSQEIDLKYTEDDIIRPNHLIVAGDVSYQEVISKFLMTRQLYNEWRMGKKIIYLHGSIEYSELVNRTISKYLFCAKLEPNGSRFEPDFYNGYQLSFKQN